VRADAEKLDKTSQKSLKTRVLHPIEWRDAEEFEAVFEDGCGGFTQQQTIVMHLHNLPARVLFHTVALVVKLRKHRRHLVKIFTQRVQI